MKEISNKECEFYRKMEKDEDVQLPGIKKCAMVIL